MQKENIYKIVKSVELQYEILCEPQDWNNRKRTKKLIKSRRHNTKIFREKKKKNNRDEFLTCEAKMEKTNDLLLRLRGLETENPFF